MSELRITMNGILKNNGIPTVMRQVEQGARITAMTTARYMEREARQNADKPGLAPWSPSQHPAVRTGNLYSAIQATPQDTQKYDYAYTVFVGKNAPYGAYLESGTWVIGLIKIMRGTLTPRALGSGAKMGRLFPYPFFEPAYRSTVPFFMDRVKDMEDSI